MIFRILVSALLLALASAHGMQGSGSVRKNGIVVVWQQRSEVEDCDAQPQQPSRAYPMRTRGLYVSVPRPTPGAERALFQRPPPVVSVSH